MQTLVELIFISYCKHDSEAPIDFLHLVKMPRLKKLTVKFDHNVGPLPFNAYQDWPLLTRLRLPEQHLTVEEVDQILYKRLPGFVLEFDYLVTRMTVSSFRAFLRRHDRHILLFKLKEKMEDDEEAEKNDKVFRKLFSYQILMKK